MSLAVALTLWVGAAACARRDDTAAPAEARRWTGDALAEGARHEALAGIARLDSALRALEGATRQLDGGAATTTAARAHFIAARREWKRVEWLVEAYTPTAARQLNGPPLPEVEYTEGHRPIRLPEGFQVVEALLWPDAPSASRETAPGEVATMRQTLARVRQILEANVLLDGLVWDAARQEVIRVATLGLGGFDSPVAGRHLIEAREALAGVRDAITRYAPRVRAVAPAAWADVEARFAAADTALAVSADPERADFLRLLTDAVLPVARALQTARDASGIRLADERRVWRTTAATPFDRDALDPFAFAGSTSLPLTEARVALGEALAFSTVLSADGSRSCTTCHQPARAYTDGARVRAPLGRETHPAPRNTPTLLNAALQSALFADQRVVTLEDQVADVVANAAEMHGDLTAAAARLDADPTVRARVAQAFADDPSPAGTPVVTAVRVQQAIAAWERSLVRLDSRFDRAVRGETTLTAEESRGFSLFMGKGKCGTCHFAPLFGGAIPPGYQKTEFEVLGTPATARWRGARVDRDPGRAGLTHVPLHEAAFRTPTLRNVALTAPYMHNGVYATLEEVIEFYARGGGQGIGAALPHQTLPPDRVALAPAERRALIAFLRTLTDTTGIRHAPRHPLPPLPMLRGTSTVAAAATSRAAASR